MLEWMGMMLVGFGSGELDRVEAVLRSSGKNGRVTRAVEKRYGTESARRVSSWAPETAGIIPFGRRAVGRCSRWLERE